MSSLRKLAVALMVVGLVATIYSILGTDPLPEAAPAEGAAERILRPTAEGSPEVAGAIDLEGQGADEDRARVVETASPGQAREEREPGLRIDLEVDPGIPEGPLELAAHYRSRSKELPCEIRRDGSICTVYFDPPIYRTARYVMELRSIERTASTGRFQCTLPEPRTLSLRLREVGRIELLLEDDRGRSLHEWLRPDTFDFRAEPWMADTYPVGGDRIKIDLTSLLEVDSAHHGYLELGASFPSWLGVEIAGFEPAEFTLTPRPGDRLTRTLTLRRLPTSGTLSGTVTAASGSSPDPEGLTGRVRIVSTENRKVQFNVPLVWSEGVATWESVPLPVGSYRVWLDDIGPIHTTPGETRMLTPPQVGIDWIWEDGAERRAVAVRVFAEETGARLYDAEYTLRISEDRQYYNRIWNELLRRDLPADSPWIFEIGVEGREPALLRMSDFSERGFLDHQGREAVEGTPAWFCDVYLPLSEDD